MSQAVEAVFPYLGTCGWYRRWLAGEAEQPQGHALTRATMSDGQILSVPVEGGNRRLRCTLTPSQLQRLTLSDHGAWSRVHLGAIRALYGRAPYFLHYIPALEEIYGGVRAGDSFHRFTAALHSLFVADIDAESFRHMRLHEPKLFAALRAERMVQMPDCATLLHAFMLLGPETPFALF